MSDIRKKKIEFGDFQTSDSLAQSVCAKLSSIGISPDVVIEPTCGVGAFVLAAVNEFSSGCKIHGFEVNEAYLEILRQRLLVNPKANNVKLAQADFFSNDWKSILSKAPGSILVLGNFPWVTNATQGVIGEKIFLKNPISSIKMGLMPLAENQTSIFQNGCF